MKTAIAEKILARREEFFSGIDNLTDNEIDMIRNYELTGSLSAN